jgi:hypothetical protein
MSTLESYMANVEAITLRDVAGAGSQVEIQLKCRRGWALAIRCIAPAGRTIRVTDLRSRDKRTRRKPFVSVPMAEVSKAFGPLAVRPEARGHQARKGRR